MRKSRRSFLQNTLALAVSTGLPIKPLFAGAGPGFTKQDWASGQLYLLSDGHLQLPQSTLYPDSIDKAAMDQLLQSNGIIPGVQQPDCNVTLWQQNDRNVLFDVGAGSNFMPSAGELVNSLDAAGIDPADITDVVFTHAHPDHLWGLLDDFDDLLFPDAQYHMHQREWNYWLADDTLAKTPDARKSFVAGAQNRLPLLQDNIRLFQWGDELLPGVEAVDTHGHTPGHTSFVLHDGNDSLMVVGDALLNAVISFQQPVWVSGADQNPDEGVATRLKLLDRLATEQTRIVGFHLPQPGLGRVARSGKTYRFADSA